MAEDDASESSSGSSSESYSYSADTVVSRLSAELDAESPSEEAAAPVAARGERSFEWGPWSIAPIYSKRGCVNGARRHVGWGAVCGVHHNEGDENKAWHVQCKKQLHFGDAMTDDEATSFGSIGGSGAAVVAVATVVAEFLILSTGSVKPRGREIVDRFVSPMMASAMTATIARRPESGSRCGSWRSCRFHRKTLVDAANTWP